jgi:hypothetical protein
LEESIKARDTAHVGTNNAVKNLEVHHVATLTDLKGRIVRCDSAIGKLGGDVRSCFDSIRQLNNQQQEVVNRIMDRMNGIEQQVSMARGQSRNHFLCICKVWLLALCLFLYAKRFIANLWIESFVIFMVE